MENSSKPELEDEIWPLNSFYTLWYKDVILFAILGSILQLSFLPSLLLDWICTSLSWVLGPLLTSGVPISVWVSLWTVHAASSSLCLLSDGFTEDPFVEGLRTQAPAGSILSSRVNCPHCLFSASNSSDQFLWVI